ncbi:hypothetical protein NFI96_021989, partial [Prochilodus magdalenae]
LILFSITDLCALRRNMVQSEAECFLNGYQSEIIQRVRNVDSLVDILSERSDSEPSILTKEMASRIRAERTEQEKMRQVYDHLNSSRAYVLTAQWLEESEPDMIEDLKNKSDADLEAPAHKRPRKDGKDVDETDCDSNKPNLKTHFTFAKLEEWVSCPENSQHLIDELENKLGDGQMEALKEKLKDKKLKKSLCFGISEVKKIDSNQKLKIFFQAQGAEFPTLALDLFFMRERELPLQSAQEQQTNKQGPMEVQRPNGEHKAPPEDVAMTGVDNSKPYTVEGKTNHWKYWAARRSNQTRELKVNKVNERYRLLREWVKNKGHTEEEAKNILGCISIENQVQHREYPCFIAEKVMVYADPQTGERQIIVIDEKNVAAKKALPKEIRILLNYQMWVCGVQTAVLIGREGKVINYDPAFAETIRLVERLVLEVFGPSLAVFKRVQRERLNSLIGNH